tara:strand:+ start:1786 stop:2781 length:996 start_codon:yes stop_codon:yes gene_type:complete
MSHKWWHFAKSDEEKRLEVINDEIEQHERMIAKDKSGAVLDALKNPLERLQKEKAKLKVDNPDSEFIQDNFTSTGETGIFGGSEDNPMIENIKRTGTNAALNYANVPGTINYDTGKNVIDTFQEEGVGEAADKALNLIKNGFIQEGLKVASGAGIPINTIMALANNPITRPFVQPALTDASNMFSDVTGGYGPRVLNAITDPFNLFGGTSGILNNQQNVVSVEEPVIQPSVIDNYIASLGQSNTTQKNDGSQTISGGTTDPADDIVVTNLPKPVYQPTMADVAGPSSNDNFTPSRPNTPPPGYSPRRRTGPNLTNRATGGLVSVSRYLKGR